MVLGGSTGIEVSRESIIELLVLFVRRSPLEVFTGVEVFGIVELITGSITLPKLST